MEDIIGKIQLLQNEKPLTRFWTFQKDPGKIGDMRKQYDNALGLFHVRVINVHIEI
jgi:hypothetical protein